MKVLKQSSHKIDIFSFIYTSLISTLYCLFHILKKEKKELSEKKELTLDFYSNKEMKQDKKKQ